MTDAERLALMAHELRSPVAALAALADGAGTMPSASVGRVVELAVWAGRDIERLLSDPDLLSLRLEEVEVAQLLDLLTRPGLSCSAEPATLLGDPTRLRQALGNLVANGLRHGSAVTVVARREGGRIVIDVSDDGPGVATGQPVFDRGVSGVGSSGYGLWLSRAIARAHGGGLELTSAPGEGAVFTLWLPAAVNG